MNEERDTLVLEFEDGTEEELEVVGVFEVDGKDYMALVPIEPEDDDVEVFFYQYVEINEDEFELEDLDDEEFDKVSAKFEEFMSEE